MVIYHFYHEEIEVFLNLTNGNEGLYQGFVFLFASYLFGHIISQMSAYLDEWVYDPLKRKVYNDHKGVNMVLTIRREKYGNELTPVYVNAYKWSVFKLQMEYPEAAAEVDRYMADSKFFRGLFIILTILVFVFTIPPNQNWKIGLVCFVLAVFSMIRYFKKRRKATETAYQYIIFLEILNSETNHNGTK